VRETCRPQIKGDFEVGWRKRCIKAD